MSSTKVDADSAKEVSENGNNIEKPKTNGDTTLTSKDKKSSTKDSKSSSKKRRRSRSKSKRRSRSAGRRSRSRHKSPKRRRSPGRKRRSRSRDRRSRSRDRRRRRSRSKERRSRRSRSRNRKRKRSRNSSSNSSGSSDSEKDKTKSKDESVSSSKKDKDGKKNDSKELTSSKTNHSQNKENKQEKKGERKRSRSPDHRRRRSRSRSHKRRRRRSRSRERRRSRDRSRRSPSPRSRRSRSRKRSRSRDRDRDKSKSTNDKEKKSSKFTDVDPLSKDFEQAKLEDEMNKRRERVEKWRKEQKSGPNKNNENDEDENGKPRKVWSLEDDDDDDEEDVEKTESKEDSEKKEDTKKVEEKEDDEIDPLDAFMIDLSKDKNKEDNIENDDGNDNSNGPKVSRISAVATKSKPNKALKNKGELMEGNMDAMEYSSEEEEESLDKAFSKYQNKQQPKKLEAEIDHSKIDYESFRKNFYVEVPELAALTPEEVDEMRMNMENIKIRGKNCPKPIQSWVQAGVSYKMLGALKKANYEKPTIIQAQAIPAVMSGSDLIGIAKTGSGKTIAFLLPMFRQIMDQRPLENGEGPIAVIMTPTRELALQITKECKKFSRPLKLRTVCVYGGTGISEQIADLKRGAEIIVCTPGRMIDMLTVNNGRVTNMRRCTYLVLDEADRMFDMGFEPQVMHVIKSCRPDRQTVLFSATFPRQMEALARRILNKPIEVQVGGRSIVCSDVKQEMVILSDEQKYLKLLELLGQYQELGAVLVFVDKQERADSLLKDLMGSSYPCMALHGGIDQYDRDSIINDFKNGVNRLLIATSVAARGLDVKNLILVVNYCCPNHYEDYVHRCGRTGRAGKKGTAITFITEEQARYSGEIIKALELSGAKVPASLEELWSKFKEEQQSQGKSVKSNSGFSGRGFKFDETEEAMAKERKQIQKAALGLQDSDDEEPAQNIDEKIESMFNSKKTVKDVSAPLGNVPGASGATGAGPGANKAKLDVAKRLASRINMQKNLGAGAQDVMQQAATALMKGGVFAGPKVSAKTIAEQLAEKINQKLNYVPQEKPDVEEEEEDNTLKRYEEELEINDFPQTCRWKVTSKDTLLQICEYSEAGITIRGQYFPPGKQPGEEDRKLYLAIEAVSELAVQKAKNEITRLIKEELIRLQNSYQPISKNRYKVM